MNLNLKQNKKLQKAKDVKIPKGYFDKIDCGSELLNTVFGGGIVKGSSLVMYAQAGIGKSTLMLNTMQLLSIKGLKAVYCSGEESVHQLANTCKRINTPDVNLANLTNIDEICQLVVDEKIDFLVIDSIPSLTTSNPKHNKRTKEEYVINKIVSTSKETGCIILSILHQTKDGKFLGGTGIIHAVDVELKLSKHFEHDVKGNEIYNNGRYISSIKNRFGNPCGVEIIMTDKGFDLNPKPPEPVVVPYVPEIPTPKLVKRVWVQPDAIDKIGLATERFFQCWFGMKTGHFHNKSYCKIIND